MNDNAERKVFAELYYIIKTFNNEMKMSIPDEFVNFLSIAMDPTYGKEKSYTDRPLNEQDLLPLTRAWIHLIYRDFILTAEEREAFIEDVQKRVDHYDRNNDILPLFCKESRADRDIAKKIYQRAEKNEIQDLDTMADEVLKDCKETSAEIIQVIIRHMNERMQEDKKTPWFYITIFSSDL